MKKPGLSSILVTTLVLVLGVAAQAQQPMKFELILNLKTAKRIGVTIQPIVLMRATRVIK